MLYQYFLLSASTLHMKSHNWCPVLTSIVQETQIVSWHCSACIGHVSWNEQKHTRSSWSKQSYLHVYIGPPPTITLPPKIPLNTFYIHSHSCSRFRKSMYIASFLLLWVLPVSEKCIVFIRLLMLSVYLSPTRNTCSERGVLTGYKERFYESGVLSHGI